MWFFFFLNIYFIFRICMCLCTYVHMSAGQRYWILWNCTSTWLWAHWCGCWELSFHPLEEQCMHVLSHQAISLAPLTNYQKSCWFFPHSFITHTSPTDGVYFKHLFPIILSYPFPPPTKLFLLLDNLLLLSFSVCLWPTPFN